MSNHSPIKIERYECYLPSDPDLFLWECSCGEEGEDHDTFSDALDSINAHITIANAEEIDKVSKHLMDIAIIKDISIPQFDFKALAMHVIEKGYKL